MEDSKWIKKGNIFNDHHSQLPVVDILEDSYRIYYSTRDNDGRSIPMSLDFNRDLSQRSSPNKIDLKLGDRGYFDWSGIMPTSIVTLKNGVKYLYYIGWSRRIDIPYHNNLGLAISEDNGITWKKFSKGPIFHTSYNEPGYIGTVDILIEDDIWRMWYLSCREWIEHEGKIEPIYDIKYAVSKDGIKWDPTNDVCIPLKGEEGGISSARILKISDTEYKMWFSVRDKIDYRTNPEKSYRIESAFSTDGIKWTRNGLEMGRSLNESWDDFMVAYPYIIKEGTKKIMFYNGNGFGKTGIGYSVCS